MMVVTLQTLVSIQVISVLVSQAIFTSGLIYYSIKSKFFKMSFYFILNRFIQEVSLVIFLIGATILSFNKDNTYNETFLFILEIIMTTSLGLSIIIEILVLIRTICLFLLKSLVMCTDCYRNKINLVYNKKEEEEEEE